MRLDDPCVWWRATETGGAVDEEAEVTLRQAGPSGEAVGEVLALGVYGGGAGEGAAPLVFLQKSWKWPNRRHALHWTAKAGHMGAWYV